MTSAITNRTTFSWRESTVTAPLGLTVRGDGCGRGVPGVYGGVYQGYTGGYTSFHASCTRKALGGSHLFSKSGEKSVKKSVRRASEKHQESVRKVTTCVKQENA